MKTSNGFLALSNRYIVSGKLVSEAPLHVGGAPPSGDTDAPFLSDSAGKYYIPGSSVRGVLRSKVERILQSLEGERGCVLFAEGTHGTCVTDRKNLERFEKTLAGTSDKERGEKLLAHVLGPGQCDVCKLFGSPLMASKLRIDDCRLKSAPAMIVRDGVGIDRDTDAARDKFKYNFEALDEGAVFSFCLQVDNASSTDLALLGMMLSEMREPGIEVGGKRSRGFGRVKLKPDATVSYFDSAAMYLSKRMQTMKTEEFLKQLNGHLESYLRKEPANAA